VSGCSACLGHCDARYHPLRFLALPYFRENVSEKRTEGGPRSSFTHLRYRRRACDCVHARRHTEHERPLCAVPNRPLEALTAARADIPDLMISDVAAPELSGIELAIRMKAQYPGCKILLFPDRRIPRICSRMPAIGVITSVCLVKPVFPDELLSEINRIDDEPNCQPQVGSTPGLHLVR
jgi:CheY-like chemotaxis protein